MKVEKKEIVDLQADVQKRIEVLQTASVPNSAELFDLNMLDSNISLFLLNSEFHDGPMELGSHDTMIKDALLKFRLSRNDKSDAEILIASAADAAEDIVAMIRDAADALDGICGGAVSENIFARFEMAESFLLQIVKLRDAGKITLKKWQASEIPLALPALKKNQGKKKTGSTKKPVAVKNDSLFPKPSKKASR